MPPVFVVSVTFSSSSFCAKGEPYVEEREEVREEEADVDVSIRTWFLATSIFYHPRRKALPVHTLRMVYCNIVCCSASD
jgi:hypothetical protein